MLKLEIYALTGLFLGVAAAGTLLVLTLRWLDIRYGEFEAEEADDHPTYFPDEAHDG